MEADPVLGDARGGGCVRGFGKTQWVPCSGRRTNIVEVISARGCFQKNGSVSCVCRLHRKMFKVAQLRVQFVKNGGGGVVACWWTESRAGGPVSRRDSFSFGSSGAYKAVTWIGRPQNRLRDGDRLWITSSVRQGEAEEDSEYLGESYFAWSRRDRGLLVVAVLGVSGGTQAVLERFSLLVRRGIWGQTGCVRRMRRGKFEMDFVGRKSSLAVDLDAREKYALIRS